MATITNATTPVRDTIKRVKDFSLNVENPSGQRDEITKQLRTQTDQFYQQATFDAGGLVLPSDEGLCL